MGQKRQLTTILILLLGLGSFFNSCAPSHEGNTDLSSLSVCRPILAEEFKAGYYPFVRANCASCHESGPGSGFFASANADLSFSAFMSKTEAKISQFAMSTHKVPYTGVQLTGAVTVLQNKWASAQSKFADCQAISTNPGDPLPPPPTAPDKFTLPKQANPAAGSTVTIGWNTATDFVNPMNAFNGGSISVTVRANNISGVTSYQFENLRFINRGATAALIKSISIYVNDVLVDGETFLYVERYIPNIANNNSRRLAPGAAFFASPIGQPIDIKIAISVLAAADIDFQPVTYAALTAAGGIFANNCQGCHGSDGGLSLAANSYNTLVGRTANSDKTLVSPSNLVDNYLYQRMNDPASPMPPNGLLQQTDRNKVRDWILDGAPLNDQSIAR